jgi:hypothetical protein
VVAAWILGVVSIVFLLLAAWRLAGADVRFHMQGRIWLMLGVIFGVVSAWLFYQG